MFKRFYSSRWVQFSAFSLLSIVVLFGAYYFVYVDKHGDQLAEYRLKMLSEAGRNAENEIDRLWGNVANAVKKIQKAESSWTDTSTIGGALSLIPKLAYKPDLALKIVDSSSQKTEIPSDRVEAVTDGSKLGAELVQRGGRAVIQFVGVKSDSLGGFWAWAGLDEHLIPVLPREDADKVTFWGRDTTFILKDFDNVIIAREDGSVLFNVGQEPLLELIKLPLPITKKTKKKSDAEDTVQQVDFPELGSRTQIIDVNIAGTPYKMFLQPIRVPIAIWYESDNGANKEKTWTLAGLQKASMFRAQAMSISPSIILGVTGLLIIALLALPFMKVQFIGIREGLKGHDVFILVVSLLVASSIITYGVLELLVNGQLRTDRDENLRVLSRDIEATFLDEVDALDVQLRKITEKKAEQGADGLNGKQEGKVKQLLGRDDTEKDTTKWYKTYPFFEMVYWMDPDGYQVEKWSVQDETTALINVSGRKYFRHAFDRDLWEKPRKKEDKDYTYDAGIDICDGLYIESIRSKNTGEVFAVLSHRIMDNDTVVAAVISPFLSTIRPVVPPGYGFCIIEENGTVLFHSDATRNLRENLFHWVNVKDKIQAAMFSRTDSYVDVTYRAEPCRFYAKPLGGTPWSLVVFAKNEPSRNTRVEILIFSLLLYSFFLFVLLVAFIWLHYARSAIEEPGKLKSPFEWFWPSIEKAGLYVKIALASLTVIFTWLFLMFFWVPIPGIFSAVLFAVLCLTLAYVLLLDIDVFDMNKKQRHRLSLGFAMAVFFALGPVLAYNIINLGNWAILIVLLLAVVCIVSLRHLMKSMYWIVSGLILLEAGYCFFKGAVPFGVTGLLVLITYYYLTRWQLKDKSLLKRVKKHWKVLCVGSALSLVVVLGILPPVTFYRAVHDEAAALFTKRQQLEFSKRLQKRAERKYDRYRNIALDSHYRAEISKRLYPGNPDTSVDIPGAWDVYAEKDWMATEFYGELKLDSAITFSEQPIIKKLGENLPSFTWLGHQLRELTATTSYKDTTWADTCYWYWTQKGNTLSKLALSMPGYRRHIGFGKEQQSATQQTLYKNLELVSPVVYFSPKALWHWLLAVVLVLGAFWVAINAVVLRLFQLDMLHPVFLSGKELPNLQAPSHMLILRGGHGDEENLYTGDDVHHIDSAELRWKAHLAEFIEAAKTSARQTICVEDFHDGLGDPQIAERKLELIERLLTLKEKTIIIRSDINPLHYFNMLSADHHRGVTKISPDIDRWSMVLDSFTRCRNSLEKPTVKAKVEKLAKELMKLGVDESVQGPPGKPRPTKKELKRILEYFAEECWPDPYLVEIARRFACHPDLAKLNDRRHVVAQVLDMAEAYYQRLWTISGKDEKMVLYRLCREGGFVSWQSREIVRRLIHRGLILIAPHFRPMNESFRRFVVRAELPEVFASWEKEAGISPWSRLKWPLVMAAVILLGFFFATQQDVFQEILAVTAALAVGTPALIRIVATLMQSRSTSGSDS